MEQNNMVNYSSLISGVDYFVPLLNGRYVRGINFDNAATTPPFITVLNEVNNFSPLYSSYHRGVGYKSQLSSTLYDYSKKTILDFVKCDPNNNIVIYVKNTTEAINKLSNRIKNENGKDTIICTDMEHHSNDLPWRQCYNVLYTKIDKNNRLCIQDLEENLKAHQGKVKLVAVTGASNVTGYINPVHKIASLAHEYGAKILVDGAQLIPHSPFDMKPDDSMEHIDYLVFSSHKMYSPFGIGVLIGPKKTFENGEPDYKGGGTVDIVTHDYIKWTDPPDKDEAGSPNILGAVSLGVAVKTLSNLGMKNIEDRERKLISYIYSMLKKNPQIILYTDDNLENRVSIIPFNIEGVPHQITAQILSYEFGISTRSGCFCAQPYVQEMLNISKEEIDYLIHSDKKNRPGMVRISLGLYNSYDEIKVLLYALNHIINNKALYLQKYENKSFSFF